MVKRINTATTVISLTLAAAGCISSAGAEFARTPVGEEVSLELCSDSATLQMDQAKRLRDELSDTHGLNAAQLSQISQTLDAARTQCGSSWAAPSIAFIGALYVMVGDRWLSEHNYANARSTFETAEHLFSEYSVRGLGWLEALRGLAYADIGEGAPGEAERTASTRTKLIKTWIAEGGYPKQWLVDALRFEAEIDRQTGQSARATGLDTEADNLESQP